MNVNKDVLTKLYQALFPSVYICPNESHSKQVKHFHPNPRGESLTTVWPCLC